MKVETASFAFTAGSISLRHGRHGLQSTAEADDQGMITLTATGPAPRNEDGALEAAARLVRAQNKAGGDWSVPTQGKNDIDSYAADSAGNKLRMQVVRANPDKGFWQTVSEAGTVTTVRLASAVALEVLSAILTKSRRYPAEQKKALFLVLDAARTPSHTFQRVIQAFRASHLAEGQKAGFAQVWLVGPQDTLVQRLD